jgi:GT2 family glycosyltransferase
LFFLDADILVKPDSLGSIVALFDQWPQVGALIGSFGKETKPQNSITVYKNLLHHYTHQTAEQEAATFCGGFGAIRRVAFDAVGGFDPRHRFLEDVEMGLRLHQAGMAIALVRDLQFTHCKRYTLGSLIRSDLFGRAIPWTQLALSKRVFRNDLNTRTHNILSVPTSLMMAAGILALPVLAFSGYGMGAEVATGMAAIMFLFVWLNRAFLTFLAKERGAVFAIKGALLLWLGYLYSALGVAIGLWRHFIHRKHVALPATPDLKKL